MKLVTYNTGTGPRCGVLQDDSVIDVSGLLGTTPPLRDVQALLETGDDALDRVRAALQDGNSSAPVFALEDVQLQSPILRPPTIRDFMIFEEHATQRTRCPIHRPRTCWTTSWN